jgi:hypothetical protein
MRLTSPSNDPAATSGTTLGGATITDTGDWSGTWEAIPTGNEQKIDVTIPSTSAAIVKITTD